jgi:GMP synthase (glutamine-hydrolysing)
MTDQDNILVIRHVPGSSLGLLETVLQQEAVPYRYLDMAAGEALLESIACYSHLIILGGPVSAYEAEQYPFLKDEFNLIESAIEQQIPTLGICLGAQILAHVLGAKVYRGTLGREIGWCELHLTEAGHHDPLLKGFPQQFQVFESHQDTFDLPSNCVHLASSNLYPNQAFRYQDHVWATQFHLEMSESVLLDCADVIEQEIEDSQIQHTSFAELVVATRYQTPQVTPLAEGFMQQFLASGKARVFA